MLEIVREWTREQEGGILDLYCGAGLIGLAIADKAHRLVGVEEVPQAIEDARWNGEALMPGCASFHAGKVEDILPRISGDLKGFGTVVVDPPRKGLAPEALSAIAGLSAPLLVYVSCDPATFARDLRALVGKGFILEELVPLDMFPQSYHIELVAKLRRNKPA